MKKEIEPLWHSIAIIALGVGLVALSLGAIISTNRADDPYNAAQEAHMRCIEEFRTASELAGCNSMYQAQKNIR